MPSYKRLVPGDHAPWFRARTSSTPDFAFDAVAGRYLVLCFFMTADACGQNAINVAFAERSFFDDAIASFFGVSIDPADEANGRAIDRVPGWRFFWDFDGQISKLYGALPGDAEPDKGTVQLRRMWVVLDPTLRVLRVIPFAVDGSDGQELVSYLKCLPPPSRFAGFEIPAPVLVLPNVFEAEFCEKLVDLYETHGSQETGYMRDVGATTVHQLDPGYKRRRDHIIDDQAVVRQIQARFVRKVVPQLLKAYQYKATKMERYLVGCYRAEDGGHFVAHRDNTTKATAHRRFAASVNLNSDFDGGEICFPEFGPRSFKPPPGGAVVFSCSLLHSVSRVTRNCRYAFLPFLYDDEAAKIRDANKNFVADAAHNVNDA